MSRPSSIPDDPYAPPRQSIGRPSGRMTLAKILFSFRGRIGRGTLWAATVGWGFAVLLLLGGLPVVYATAGRWAALGAGAVIALPLLWILLAVQTKRWHDLNESGWLWLIAFWMINGPVVALAFLGFIKGSQGSNFYGSNPLRIGNGLPAQPMQLRDRKTSIQVMGALAFVTGLELGALGSVYGVLLPVLFSLAPPEGRTGLPLGSDWMRALMGMAGLGMAVMAAASIWLGIGAVRLRRWAGDLHLAAGWLFGVIFTITAIVTVVQFPATLAGLSTDLQAQGHKMGPAELRVAEASMAVAFAVVLAAYLVPPLMSILIFGRKSVKETLVWYDRGPSWTDGLAQPVLIWWLWLAVSAVCMLVMAPAAGPLYGMMGLVQESWQATAAMAGFAAGAGICAWGVMTKKAWSWYGSVCFLLAFGGAGWLVMGKMDFVEFYRRIGVKEDRLDAMVAMYGGGTAYELSALVMLAAMLLFLLITKRYYRFPAKPNPAV